MPLICVWGDVTSGGVDIVLQGSPQKKKSSGRSQKNLNLAREQRNNMFTVARACAIKKLKIFSLRHTTKYSS